MRVLITGGTGFIGSRVTAAAVERGHDVSVLSRSPGPTPHVQYAHDLTKKEGLTELLRGVEAVVHCAAAMEGSEEAQRAATVQGTNNLVAAMREAGVRRMILVSSFAVYDYEALPAGAILTEDTPIDHDGRSRGPYIAAKREQEQIVRNAPDLEWTLFRPGLVFGEGRTWFWHIGARHSRFWVTMAGSGLLPLTHVDNCAGAIAAALDTRASVNAVLNVVDNELPTRTEYAKLLAAHESSRLPILDVPWSVLNAASLGARALTLGVVTPPGSLNPAVLAARCKPLRYDNSRVRSLLAWAPRMTIEQGLRQAGSQAR